MADEMISLDYGFCAPEVLGEQHGLELAEFEQRVRRAQQWMDGLRQEGKLGFFDLPSQDQADLAPIVEQAERLRGLADTLVVLGIGGSALGTTAVDMALAGTLRNVVPRPEGAMRVLVADNPEPRSFGQLLDGLDLQRTAFNVISKSGSTAETMSQFLVVRELLEQKLGAEQAVARLVFTTDPELGNLRLIARDEPVACLEVPRNVGGRYSVLSAVGLLPLACAGHDLGELLAGAAEMAQRVSRPGLADNPAAVFAALCVGYSERGRNVLVMMPYASDLFGLAQWFAQLWAESLGKARGLDGELVHRGQTPVAAVGTTDQHSQLQLYMEGPQDKLVVFILPEDYQRVITIPRRYQQIESLAYLGGQTLCRLAQAEAAATAAALAGGGRPSMTLRLPAVNARCLGQVLLMLEAATVIAGGMLGVDPLDQPGVEMSKRLTYGLMGRRGFEDERRQMEGFAAAPRFVV